MTFEPTGPEQEAVQLQSETNPMASAEMTSLSPPPLDLGAGGGFGAETNGEDVANAIQLDGPLMANSQLSVSPEADAQPIQARFTVSATLSAKGDNEFPARAVNIDEIQLPEKDRPDTQYGSKQWSHGVAWTSMVAFWRKKFSGPLHKVIQGFMEMAREDQSSDSNSESKALRAKAVSFLQGWEERTASISEWRRRLNFAISFYIQAYQKSSYATHKTKPGGRGEPQAKAKLQAFESKAETESSQGKPSSLDPQEVYKQAMKLIDISFRQGPDQLMKVYDDWIRMLTTNYHFLGEALIAKLVEKVGQKPLSGGYKKKFKVDTLAELFMLWKTSKQGNSMKIEQLDSKSPSKDSEMGFVVNTVMSARGQREYSMDEVLVENLEMSERDRPSTQFKNRQLSHFVAWTGKIVEWRKSLTGGSLRQILKRLVSMAQRDLSGNENEESTMMLKQFGVILHYLKKDPPIKTSLANWTQLLNRSITLYAQAYQKSSSTTHTDKPGGRGEAVGKSNLQKLEAALAGKGTVALPEAQKVIRSAKMLLDAPFDKSSDKVCKAYDDWLIMLEHSFPNIMKQFGGDILKYLMGESIPNTWATKHSVDNLYALISLWRKQKPRYGMGLPSSDEKKSGSDSKVDKLAPSEAQLQEILRFNLGLRRIPNDGDCLYNSLIRAGVSGVPGSVKALREAVAKELQGTDYAEAQSIRRGGWVGHGADAAPGILARLYDIGFLIIHGNGAIEYIGNGNNLVYLVLIQGPPQHYHLAK